LVLSLNLLVLFTDSTHSKIERGERENFKGKASTAFKKKEESSEIRARKPKEFHHQQVRNILSLSLFYSSHCYYS